MVSFNKRTETNRTLTKIISILLKNNNKMNIADLVKEMEIKRSTLVFHIETLIKMGFLEKERLLDTKGRPTIIRIKPSKYEELKISAKKQEEYYYEILSALDKKGEMLAKDYFKLLPFNLEEPDAQQKFEASLKIQSSGYVNKVFKVSDKGKKFLEEYKK